MVRTAPVPTFVSVTFVSGITAPVGSATCPEIDPEVCADKLAADDIARMNTKMQQAMEALHRPSNLIVLRTIGARPSDSSVTWEFERRNGATRPFPDESLA